MISICEGFFAKRQYAAKYHYFTEYCNNNNKFRYEWVEDTVKTVNLTRPWSSFSTTPLRFPQRLKIAKPESRAPLSAPNGGKRLSLPEMCKERQHLRLSSSSFPFCVMWVMGLVCYTAVFCVVTQRSAPQGALRDDTKKRLLCVADYLISYHT